MLRSTSEAARAMLLIIQCKTRMILFSNTSTQHFPRTHSCYCDIKHVDSNESWHTQLKLGAAAQACESTYHSTTGISTEASRVVHGTYSTEGITLQIDSLGHSSRKHPTSVAFGPDRPVARCRSPTSMPASITTPSPLIASTHTYRPHHTRTR